MPAIDVEIEKIVAGGDGLGRHGRRVVFVPETAPGERHRVEIFQEKKDYLRGRSLVCQKPAASRRRAPCRYYGSCGGCSLMHLEPEAQLEAKRGILRESLARSGVPDSEIEVRLTPSPEQGYRTRLRFHVSRQSDRLKMGFRRRGSHDVEDVDHCLLAASSLNDAWRRVRLFFEAEPALARALSSVELQESGHDPGRIIGHFRVRSNDDRRRFESDVRERLLGAASLEGLVVGTDSQELRAGRPFVHHRVAGLELRQRAGAFFQANRFLVDELVASVMPAAPVSRAVDLYCGVGLLTIPLAQRARHVIGVESSSIAVRDAIANAGLAGVDTVRFIRSDATRFAEGFRFDEDDYVVVDPPRGGLSRRLRRALARTRVRELCYVSCDPAALGRDTAFFYQHGFELRRLELLDFFPNTHHFETVASLSRTALDSTPDEGRY